jgi:hypothetical protein
LIPSTDTDATRLAALAVAPGDGLLLVVGKRGTYFSDTSLVEWTISEVGGAKRIWDLFTDVVDDIHAGNPHADSRGQPNVWHFLGPPALP